VDRAVKKIKKHKRRNHLKTMEKIFVTEKKVRCGS
jgi:hypothetical protein